MMTGYWTTTELAKDIGIHWCRILYAHRSGTLPEPAQRIGGARAYSEAEAEQVRAYFQARKAWDRHVPALSKEVAR